MNILKRFGKWIGPIVLGVVLGITVMKSRSAKNKQDRHAARLNKAAGESSKKRWKNIDKHLAKSQAAEAKAKKAIEDGNKVLDKLAKDSPDAGELLDAWNSDRLRHSEDIT